MIATWYAIAGFMIILYLVLDGRNFGAGMLHWLVAKTPEERRQVVAAIGPLWSWHEVWLVAFGGILFAVFPRLLASAFAGYYLALFLILWCSDLARNLAGGRRPNRRSHVAGVLGFRVRARQYASGHRLRCGGRQHGPRSAAGVRRYVLDGVLHGFLAARLCGTARLVYAIRFALRHCRARGAWCNLSRAQDDRRCA